MCKKSTKTLQGYLEALFFKKEVNPKSFVNTGLNVYVTPLTYMDNYSNQDISDDVNGHREKRKRITKEQRCSLTILYIIENRDELCDSGDSEDEDLLSKPEESEDESKENMVTFEEVIVEPDIK
ncbi:hypothetical protein NQ317_000334 [Molorchus minor]|uniref:Uncharacterized protein n=1 Tax=Molorchus minor TaxID=1323400 RepID=A0ABQ9K0T6_9CUCU|nr:hypothetical protein NQ317_000334 [Molorchus minor]